MEKSEYSLEQLESLCENSPCGMGVFSSVEQAPIYLNEAYYRLVGYTKEEYIREISNDGNRLLHSDDMHITEENISDFNSNPQKINSEYRIIQKSGEVKWIRLTASPFADGEKQYGLCFFEDITAEKENLSMLKMISENSGLSISVIKVKDDSYSVIYANDRFFELVGMSKKEYMDNPNQDINIGVSEEDKDKTYRTIQESLLTGKEQDVQYIYVMGDGRKKYLSRRLFAIKSYDDSFLLLSVTTDITSEKQATMKIQEEHNRYQMVVDEMSIAVFEWNLVTGEFYTSGNYNDYALSDTDSDLLLQNKGPLDLIHPDDILELSRYAEEAKTDALRVDARLRLRLKLGGYRWVHITAIKSIDAFGNHVKTTGVVTDISNEKNKELQIQSMIDNVPTGISIYEIINNDEVISHFHNEMYYKMLGYTKKQYDELTKENIFHIVHPNDVVKAKEGIKGYSFEKKSTCIEIRMMCANGNYSWFKIDGRLIDNGKNAFTVYESFTNIDEAIKARKKERDSVMKHAIDVFTYLYNSKDVEKSISAILASIGENCNVSRAYIFEDDDNHEFCTNTFEWCAKGVIPEKDNLQQVYYADLQGDYRCLFNDEGVFNCPDIYSLSDAIVEIVEKQNIKSMLQCSIMLDNTFNGYIGFDDCKCKREWTQYEIDVLSIIAKIIGVFLKRLKASKQISEKNEKLTQIVKSIPGGVAIYRLRKNNKVSTDFVSSGLGEMCGYTQEQFFDLLKDDAMSNVVEDDIPIVTSALEEAIENKSDLNVIYRIYKKDKSPLLIRLNASLVKSNLLKNDELYMVYGVHTVVTDYEYRLIQQQVQNKMILNRLDIAYIGWNIKEGAYCSEQFNRYAISQAPLNDILSNKAGEQYVHPEDISVLNKFFENKNEDSYKTTAKIRMRMSDGTYRWTDILRFSEHDSNGNLIAALGIFMDVNEEWIEQNSYLKKTLKELECAKRSKELFFSQMSHDLRTPLNAVINLSEFAKECLDDKKELERYIESINTSGKLLLELINDGLDLEKAELGEMTLNLVPYSYIDFKNSIITIIEPLCRQKKIDFLLTDSTCNCNIMADKARVEQIFINLLSNAVKFTPKGGTIEFLCQNEKVEDNHFICDFVVRDNGIGMSKEFQKRLFQPFAQENNDNMISEKGTGLGLSIVLTLVKLMDGSVTVNSEKGKGTEIIVHLEFPIVESNFKKINNGENKESSKISFFSLVGKNVLLVEDNSLNAMIATRILENQGMKVQCCKNGKEAIDIFISSKLHYFDVILMDVRMPVMDGLSATRMIRDLNREDSKTVPIIAMSANTLNDDVKKSIEAGMNIHLSKPIDPQKLYKKLNDFFTNA